MNWSPTQYTKFESERNRPILDLLAHIPTTSVARALDLGCGPGNSTQLLQSHFPGALVMGIDNSAEMVAAAQQRLPDNRFEIADITTWRSSDTFDLILSNAVLQWVPGHETLLPELLRLLNPGGSLAVQMPNNLDEPSHRLMREIAADGPWSQTLAGLTAAGGRPPRHSADWYYRVLREGGASVDLWQTTYYHPLSGGATAVTEWFKGSGLRPFLEALDENERPLFLARYQAAIAQAYPALPDGTVLLPFPRLFFIATR